MISDTQAFREALGTFATGVTIVTACDAAATPVGVTINSFTSVSLRPPLVLFCLGREAQVADALLEAPAFAINVLAEGQRSLSDRFAFADAEARWSGLAMQRSPENCPLLPGCLAHIVCRREAAYDGGDHHILLGRVIRLDHGRSSDARPLLYYRGGYAALARG